MDSFWWFLAVAVLLAILLWQKFGEQVAAGRLDWHKVLRKAVRKHLVPLLLPQEADAVYDIETSHNPIRSDFWAWLAPDVSVLVSWSELEAMCREELGWSD